MSKKQYMTHPEAKYELTETCYVDIIGRILVNVDEHGNETKLPDPISERLWRTLFYLMNNYGRKVDYDEIGQYIYPEDYIPGEYHRIPVNLNRLRKLLIQVGVSDNAVKSLIQVKNGISFYPYNPIPTSLRTISDVIRDSGMSESELADVINCMMTQGISGRMGREMLFSLAKQGNGWAAFEVGELYYHGYVTYNHQPDFQKACTWYQKAGEHPGALWTQGYLIASNIWPHRNIATEIDFDRALDLFQRAQAVMEPTGGSAIALTSIGQLWEEGHYPAPDYATSRRFEKRDMDKALRYYHQADALGYHYATNRIGLYYERRIQHPDDLNATKAFHYYKRSADMVADGYTFNKLGLMLEKGIGCEKDIASACSYYIDSIKVLEDDVTGWCLYNAGRVYANRVKGQDARYYDISKAFDLFLDALRLLPTDKHDQILLEMIDILLKAKPDSIPYYDRKKADTLDWAESYLREEACSKIIQHNPNTSEIRHRISRL